MSEEQQVAVITSTYNGTPLQEWPFGLMLRHVSDTVEVRGADSTALGKRGVFARPRRRHKRIVLYTGWISNDPEAVADELASYRAQVTAFETLFDLEGDGDLVETLEDGSTRTLHVRPRNRHHDRETTGVPNLAEASVEFESYEDPDWDVTPAGS